VIVTLAPCPVSLLSGLQTGSVSPDRNDVSEGAAMSAAWGFETKQIHVGGDPDPATGARAVPIYQTTSYEFRDSAHAANLFALADVGFIYTRLMNPTQAAVEARVNALEGGCTTAIGLPGTLAVASGQAAETLAITTLCEAGSHVVASPSLYGGTYNLLHYSLPKMGIEVTFVDDPHDLEQWRAAIRPNTRAFYGESLANPKNDVFDVEGVSKVAHDNGIPLIIDNTIPTPWLFRPLEWGADIVVHSLTKFIGGHGTAIAGAIVDGGTFDYGASGRFPNFTEPDPSYHGLAYWPALGHGAFVLKARVQGLRDTGASIAPFNSFLILQGLETLSLRMERHNSNAAKVAAFLEKHPQVESVQYAGSTKSPWHARANKYFGGKGYGSVLAFVIKGGKEAGQKFADSLVLHSHVANIGDVRSLVIHPASTTHSQLTEAEQVSSGVLPGLVRLSVGIESIEDIIADLEVGFAAVK
jgi:O-acetylhomoserine (thiol)-lyase